LQNSDKILSGVFWTTIQALINRAFDFFVKLVLARLLFPEDFGIVGMATVFTTLIEVFNDLGMGAALIQRKKEILTDAHHHTAFWTGVVWAIVIYLFIGLVIAPFAAWFYETPLLTYIIPALSIGVLVSPVNLIHQAQLTKALDFKKLALINNAGSIFSGILALTLALLGAGVWSLVFNSVANIIIVMPLYFKATNWYPKVIWKKSCFKDIVGFGIFTTGTNLFNGISRQVDYLIIGKLLGESLLGFYSFAFLVTNVFRDQLTSIINKVMYPVFAEMQHDKPKMVLYYLKVLRTNNLIVFPIMTAILIFAPEIIPLIFGEKWTPSILLIQILSVSVLVQMLNNGHTSLIRAYGKVKIEFYLQLIKSMLFFVPLVVAGTYYYGIVGAAVAYTIAKCLSVGLSFIIMQKIFHLTALQTLKTVQLPVFSAVFIGAVSFFLIHLQIHTIIVIIVYITMYLLSYRLFAMDDWLQFQKTIKNIRVK
jgi:teichuronic acid exporter